MRDARVVDVERGVVSVSVSVSVSSTESHIRWSERSEIEPRVSIFLVRDVGVILLDVGFVLRRAKTTDFVHAHRRFQRVGDVVLHGGADCVGIHSPRRVHHPVRDVHGAYVRVIGDVHRAKRVLVRMVTALEGRPRRAMTRVENVRQGDGAGGVELERGAVEGWNGAKEARGANVPDLATDDDFVAVGMETRAGDVGEAVETADGDVFGET